MKLDATIKGYKATDRVLTELNKRIDARKKVLTQVATEIVSEAKSELQNKGHVVRGELLADVGIKKEDAESVTVGTSKLQGRILEQGRPEVRPKKPGGRLVWTDKHTGETVFATKSGPVAPDPWLLPAVLKKRKRMGDLMAQEVAKTVTDNKNAG